MWAFEMIRSSHGGNANWSCPSGWEQQSSPRESTRSGEKPFKWDKDEYTLYFQKPELGKFINIKAIKPWDELVSSLHTSSDLKCHYVEEVT